MADEDLFEGLVVEGPGIPGVPKKGEEIDQDLFEGLILDEKPVKKIETRDLTSEVKRQLGLTARHLTEGVLSVPALLAEAPRQLLNLIPGVDFPPQASEITRLLTEAGLPQPETTTERIVGGTSRTIAGGGALAGAARGLSGPVAATLAAQPAQQIAATLAAQPAQQIAGATGAGLAGETARELGAGPLGQTAAGLVGGIAGARAAAV